MFTLVIKGQNRLMWSQSTLPSKLGWIEMFNINNSFRIFCWAAHHTKRRIKQPTVINVRRCSHLALDLPPASLRFYKVFSSTESWTFRAQYDDAKDCDLKRNERSFIPYTCVEAFFLFSQTFEKKCWPACGEWFHHTLKTINKFGKCISDTIFSKMGGA